MHASAGSRRRRANPCEIELRELGAFASRLVNGPLTPKRYSDAVRRNSRTKRKRRVSCNIDQQGHYDGTRRPAERRDDIASVACIDGALCATADPYGGGTAAIC